MPVHTRSDPERKKRRLTQPLPHQIKRLTLHTHIPIRHQHHTPRHPLLPRQCQRPLQRRQQLRPTTPPFICHQIQRPSHRSCIRLHRPLRHQLTPTRKRHHIEPILPSQSTHQIRHQQLRRPNRKPIHRPRHIHNEHILPRRHLIPRHPGRWLHIQQKEVLLCPLLQKQPRRHLCIRQLIPHHHIPIRRRPSLQFHQRRRRMRKRHLRLMTRARQTLHRHPRIQTHLKLKPHRRRRALLQKRIPYPGFLLPARPRIPRPHHRRKHKLINSLCRPQHIRVSQPHLHLRPRRDVRHTHLEHIRTLLFQQRRVLLLRLRLLITRPSCPLLLDLRPDHPLPDPHLQPLHRRPRRSRKHIHRLQRHLRLIRIHLHHLHLRNDPRHLRLHPRALHRKRIHPPPIHTFHREIRSLRPIRMPRSQNRSLPLPRHRPRLIQFRHPDQPQRQQHDQPTLNPSLSRRVSSVCLHRRATAFRHRPHSTPPP